MDKFVIKFLQIREGIPPSRAHQFDAGIDFYVPKFCKEFIKDLIEKNPWLFKLDSEIKLDSENFQNYFNFDLKSSQPFFILSPHNRILIPSGLKVRMEKPDRTLIAANKSGIASKEGLIFGAHIIDFSYQGEVHLNLINTSSKNVKIYQDQKIIQFIETPIFISKIKIFNNINDKKFYRGIIKDRLDKGFGSTN